MPRRVTYYALLSLFPFLLIAISILGERHSRQKPIARRMLSFSTFRLLPQQIRS